ncbi:SIS domain-containing protein [Promethearchaeum syntrophicum]|uniref:SIS domain-containing protein n=1 Tax=Promethearchaeum syntrophicum TaxID=2594042 RepID=A0A5B9DBP3_9ARCH|nr:SIS domain-containing protein [Candidatus Prometheoarchaeum syntrophicum]QEE16451.1 Glutamine--fructose-6-phosphate aminotransferase (isomerizing) [Candidatus Prometheoarchaeum syntrophicum]
MNLFFEEISSQGMALKRTLDYIKDKFENLFGQIKILIKDRKISKLIFTGMGSSFFCNYVPLYMLKQVGFDVEMIDAGEFLFHGVPENNELAFETTCIILVSQSGESGEIVELLQKLNMLRSKPMTIGITNTPKSYLANHSTMQLYLNAGKEETVTSKTYVCSILILYFLAKSIITQNISMVSEIKEIEQIIDFVSKLFQFDQSLERIMQTLQNVNKNFGSDYKFVQILARGPSLSTAHQAALNFKEIVKINSEASSISTFRHGGIESLTELSKIIILSSSDKDHILDNRFIRNFIEKWSFGTLFYITSQKFKSIDEEIRTNPKIFIISYDFKNHFLAPIVEIIILQLMIYNTALKREITPGLFRFTQKITRGL